MSLPDDDFVPPPTKVRIIQSPDFVPEPPLQLAPVSEQPTFTSESFGPITVLPSTTSFPKFIKLRNSPKLYSWLQTEAEKKDRTVEELARDILLLTMQQSQ